MSDTLEADRRHAVRRSKLTRPRLPANAVARPRLQRLLEATDAQLTLVVAPAGSGKTTLVAQWLADAGRPSAWLRLDDADNDLERFLRHLAAAIAPVARWAADALVAELESPDRVAVPDLGSIVASELAAPTSPVVIVLDDAEWLTAPQPLAFLQALARDLDGSARLVILSRAEPSMGLGGLRLAGRVRTIDVHDLAFTPDEATDLLARIAPRVPPADVVDLNLRLEGWAAGLRIAAGAGDRAPAIHQGDIASFVIEAMFQRLSPAEAEAALRIALLDRLAPRLVAGFLDLTETAARDLLRRLGRQGVLTRETDDGWTALIPRVRDALLAHLRASVTADEIRALHARAAHAAAALGVIDVVITHALASDEIALLRRVLAPAVSDALDHEEWHTPGRWLDRLPDAVVCAEPALIVARVAIGIIRGQIATVPALIADSRAALTALDLPVATRDAYLAELDVLACAHFVPLELEPDYWAEVLATAAARIDPARRAPTAQARFFGAIALANAGRRAEAIASLGSLEPPGPGKVDTVYTRSLAAAVVIAQGRGAIAEADRIGAVLERFAGPLEFPISLGWGLIARGVAAYARGDHDDAIAHVSTVARLADLPLMGVYREAMFLLAMTFEVTGRHDQAIATIDRLEEMALDYRLPYLLPAIGAMRAFLTFVRHGLRDEHRAWLSADLPPLEHTLLTAFFIPHLVRAQLLAALGDAASLAEAESLLAAIRERLDRSHSTHQRPMVLLVSATIQVARGHDAEARATVVEAITILDQRNAPGLLFIYTPVLRRILEEISRGAGPVPAIARRALATAPGYAPGAAAVEAPVGDLLTEREQEVLAMLAWRFSDREIGDAFGISPLTARKHAGNIYRKLGVSGRRRALEDAKRRGWVAPPRPIS